MSAYSFLKCLYWKSQDGQIYYVPFNLLGESVLSNICYHTAKMIVFLQNKFSLLIASDLAPHILGCLHSGYTLEPRLIFLFVQLRLKYTNKGFGNCTDFNEVFLFVCLFCFFHFFSHLWYLYIIFF